MVNVNFLTINCTFVSLNIRPAVEVRRTRCARHVLSILHTEFWLGNPKKGYNLEDNITVSIQEM
jgi:hypothetical protein